MAVELLKATWGELLTISRKAIGRKLGAMGRLESASERLGLTAVSGLHML